MERKELWNYMKIRKKWWPLPVLILILLVGILIRKTDREEYIASIYGGGIEFGVKNETPNPKEVGYP